MKILLVQKVKGIAGSERYFLNMIPLLEKRGFSFEFLVLTDANGGHEGFVDQLKQIGVPCHTSRFQGMRIFSFFRKLKAICRSGRFNAIHSHLIHADFYMALAKMCKVIQTPLLSTKHGYDEHFQHKFGFDTSRGPIKNLYYYTAVFAEKYIDASFAVSRGVSRLFKEFEIISEMPEVIHHGVELEQNYKKDKPQNEKVRVLILGRLVSYKGVDLAIRAISKLNNVEELSVSIVGDGAQRPELKRLTDSLNLNSIVEFKGFVSYPELLLEGSDLKLLPTRGEGFGLVAIEAFAHGIPIVAFDVPAINEIVVDGKNGYLVPPFDVDLLAKRIDTLILDKELRLKMGKAAYESAKEQFTLEICADRTADFYRKQIPM